MNELLRRYAVGLAAASIIAFGGYSAQAQVLDDDDVVIEEPLVIENDEDDDEEEVVMNQSGMERCAARFRSFDPSTGTYMTYDGEMRPCPYLAQ